MARALTLESRLAALSIENRSLLQIGINAKSRLEQALSEADDHRRRVIAVVWSLRKRGVPAKTIAMALGVSKTFVVRCSPVPRVR